MSYNSKYTGAEVEALLDLASTRASQEDLNLAIERIDDLASEKQDEITDLDTIRANAAKGATALQSVPSEYVTESELTAKGYATTSQLAGKQDTISDLATIRSGAALGATALQTETYKGTVTGVKINGTTKNPSSGVVDLGTVITSHQDISGKQDKLVSGTNIKTINGTSILGSGNITISGGSSSGGSGAYAQVNHGTSDTTFALTPNTFHVWDEVASLTLTLGSEQSGVANEFVFQFTSGATATSLTLPDDIKWANDSALTIAENKIYQISVLNGLATALEFDNAVDLPINKATWDEGDFRNGGTLTFQYPVASDLTIGFIGTYSVKISAGETSIHVGWNEPEAPRPTSILPETDGTYKYEL